MVADSAASAGLRSITSQLFSALARVLDEAARIAIASTDTVSIQDLVRCSLVGSSGKRRRLDPHITGLASAKRNVTQAGAFVFGACAGARVCIVCDSALV